jgi:hypothetical protein
MTLAIVSCNAVSQECLPYMLQVYCTGVSLAIGPKVFLITFKVIDVI